MTHYVKLIDNPAFWYVKDGKRTLVESPDHMRMLGLYPIRKVTPAQLEEIPLADMPESEEIEDPKAEEEPEAE